MKRNLIVASTLLILGAAAIFLNLKEIDAEILDFLAGLMGGAGIAFLLSLVIKKKEKKKE